MKDNYEYLDGDKFKIDRNTGFGKVNKNRCLKYVLVGITPGTSESQEESKNSSDFGELSYKFRNAFCGPGMRSNLNEMFVYVNNTDKHKRKLQPLLDYCNGDVEKLFEYIKEKSIIDFTSLIKDATYKKKRDNSYQMFRTPKNINPKNNDLLKEFNDGFGEDYSRYYRKKGIIFIACGIEVYKFLSNYFQNEETLIGIVHPSGSANKYKNRFLGKSKPPYNPEYSVDKQSA